MKTFEDLEFKPHSCEIDGQQAVLNFDNGYGCSVLIGKDFYSNGIDTYELAVLHDDLLCYDTPITDDVLGHLTKKEVTIVMKKYNNYNG